ncbi:MAG: hypothetical protein KatS3mg059_1336 [Thermomicrobiales bacterium]|nr:MAG: hypothetical protein KatS3mg059_1336 [Thermomicrobiales bacterium]
MSTAALPAEPDPAEPPWLTLPALRAAWKVVKDNKGVAGGDGVTIARFRLQLDANLLALQDEVRAGTYIPGPARQTRLRMGTKWRQITVLPVRDRVLQRAVLDYLEPRLDPLFLARSYGYRPGRSIHHAVAHIIRLRDQGYTWVVDADIADCFGSLDHDYLLTFIAKAVAEPELRDLLRRWIVQPGHGRQAGPARGIPLGAPISPLLCNLYLHRLDCALRRRGLASVRYADDFVILCRSEVQAALALQKTAAILQGLRLALREEKTRIVSFDEGFDFLGVRFEGDDYTYTFEGKRIRVDESPPAAIWYYADGYV